MASEAKILSHLGWYKNSVRSLCELTFRNDLWVFFQIFEHHGDGFRWAFDVGTIFHRKFVNFVGENGAVGIGIRAVCECERAWVEVRSSDHSLGLEGAK